MEFEQIYELYFKDVFLYLRSLSATAQTAEEIAQEAFVKAWKSIESYDVQKIFVHGCSPLPKIHIIHIADEKNFMRTIKNGFLSVYKSLENLYSAPL